MSSYQQSKSLTTELLEHISKRPLLPALQSPGQAASFTNTLPDPKNIQGDVYLTFPRDSEKLLFFTVTDPTLFVKNLAKYKPTTTDDVVHSSLRKIAQAKAAGERAVVIQSQIAFTREGLDVLGHKEPIQDDAFDVRSGPQTDADAPFNSKVFHGVFLVGACAKRTADEGAQAILDMFGASMSVDVLEGNSRPDKERGHEHFGWKDGISQPALRGLVVPQKGQPQCDAGVVIMGYPGDRLYNHPRIVRPSWSRGGSLMVFRKMKQLVPEFRKYVNDAGGKWHEWMPNDEVDKIQPPLSDIEGAALFGARLFGRWKSGAPLARALHRDDPSQTTADKMNDFDYIVDGEDNPTETLCPFTAHIRKTVPRNLEPFATKPFLESTLLVRSGMPYGPEVDSNVEKEKTVHDRGLLFICYQSTLGNGFLAQQSWTRNDYFPTIKFEVNKWGQDSVIGQPPPPKTVVQVATPMHKIPKGEISLEVQSNPPNAANITVVDGFASDLMKPAVEPQFFVQDRGGAFFFVPSVETLRLWARA